MRRSYLLALAIAAAAAAWIGSGLVGGESRESPAVTPPPERKAEPPSVRVRTISAEERSGEIALYGRTEAERRVEVKAETAGRVVERPVRKGQVVREGELLARLAMDDRADRLAEAEALVEQREMAYEAARKLTEKQFRAEVKLAEERASLEAARAQLSRVRLDIERTRIRAPFAGVAHALPVEVGDYVAIGQSVAGVVDLDPILVAADIAEIDIGRVAVGAPAAARLAAGAALRGAVRYVSRVGSGATRTFRVEVAVPNPAGAVPEGLTAELRITAERRRVHRVSPAVLTLADDGRIGVKAVDEGGRVVFHAVEIVADGPDGTWIAGLPETVTVITVGQEFVRPDQIVRPMPETAGTTP